MKRLLKKLYRSKEDITKEELLQIINSGTNVILLDVRSTQEFEEGHLKGAINIPNYELYVKAEEAIKDKQAIIIAYCSVGLRSKNAIKILKALGYKNVYHLEEGIEAN